MLELIQQLLSLFFGSRSMPSNVLTPVIPEVSKYMLTLEQLKSVMPHLPLDKANLYLPHLNAAMEEAQINTKLRVAAFLAQIAEESYQLKYMQEEWGPTPQQLKYEPPSELATRLGNTQKGDGRAFAGAGPLQITGRANFASYGAALGLDLVNNPQLACMPEVGFRLAALYWTKHNLNELADVSEFRGITYKINGGYTNESARKQYYTKALSVLS